MPVPPPNMKHLHSVHHTQNSCCHSACFQLSWYSYFFLKRLCSSDSGLLNDSQVVIISIAFSASSNSRNVAVMYGISLHGTVHELMEVVAVNPGIFIVMMLSRGLSFLVVPGCHGVRLFCQVPSLTSPGSNQVALAFREQVPQNVFHGPFAR